MDEMVKTHTFFGIQSVGFNSWRYQRPAKFNGVKTSARFAVKEVCMNVLLSKDPMGH